VLSSPSTSAPAPAAQRLFGYVSDSAFRPLAGVTIEVLDGPLAGQTMTTLDTGIFNYPGTVTGAVTFRATKAGYVTATASSQSNGGVSSIVLFQLDLDVAPAQIAGDYTLTFVADAGCAGLLPQDVPALTYAATMTGQPSVAGKLDTQYTLTVRSANALTSTVSRWESRARRSCSTSTTGKIRASSSACRRRDISGCTVRPRRRLHHLRRRSRRRSMVRLTTARLSVRRVRTANAIPRRARIDSASRRTTGSC
jgi:hypothetical protein